MKYLYNSFIDLFQQLGISEKLSTTLAVSLSLVIIFLAALLAFYITRLILNKVVYRLFRKTQTSWDDFLIKRKVFDALAHFPSAMIIYFAAGFYPATLLPFILSTFAKIYFVLIFSTAIVRVANVANDIYDTTSMSKVTPIKVFVQLFQIVVIFITVILVIAILVNKSPTTLLAGLTALAAVLMLVFKDSILGFVAGIQLTANRMVKIGDWIEMPSRKADGDVIEISLTTVKVQNWDKTISTIPTYSLVSESFTNWAGMKESGGRRIKRSINIDMNSVRFCDKKLLAKLSRFYLLRDYITNKEKEIAAYNENLNVPEGEIFNGRHQTNLGIFRHYLEEYLKRNPNIHQEMTFLVRQLQPTEKGLPLEIYVFSKDQRWAYYEGIQADIFDHVLAILPEFGLKIFQNPSGSDFAGSLQTKSHQASEFN